MQSVVVVVIALIVLDIKPSRDAVLCPVRHKRYYSASINHQPAVVAPSIVIVL